MNALARRLSELSSENRALLIDRLREKAQARRGPALVRRTPGDDPVPLSFAQQRLWFLAQLEPGSALYNLCLATKITSMVDVPVLRRALDEVMARHEALRTAFVAHDGRPFQVVAHATVMPFELVDLTDLPPVEREPALRERIGVEAGRPFDLSAGPLVRALFVRLTQLDHVLVLTMHHIVSDGWSMRVLMAEIGALYQNLVVGRPSPLPELEVQYPDFSLWQRELLAGPLLTEQLAYWRSRLAGELPVLDLPTDRPRPAVQRYAGATYTFRLPETLSDALVALGRREGASLFMTLLAAFKVLLMRYTGQSDVLVGTPIAGRTRPELERLIGFFVNTLALRTDLAGDPTFRECLARVRETALGAYAHQDLPFERVVEELQAPRVLDRAPVFQVMFILQNPMEARPEVPVEYRQLATTLASGAATFEVEATSAKFDLTLSMIETPDGLLGTAEYNTDLFDAATIERLTRHYVTLLEAVAATDATGRAGVDVRIADLPLMTVEEELEVLAAGRGPAQQEPLVPVTKLIARTAARCAQAPALDGSECLTYAELERRSTCFAQRLVSAGVRPGMPVAVCLPRDTPAVVALLALWKVGATYVPLDLDYPQERLAFMLADAEVALLLTDPEIGARLPASRARMLTVDGTWWSPSENPQHPLPEPDLDQVAYIVYTSGSTGRPKGVEVLHRGLSNLIQSELRLFGLAPGRRVLQFASPSFDAALLETVLALAAGAELHLAPREALRPGPPLLELLAARGITDVTLSPSVLAVLPDDGLPKLQVVISAGEDCPADVAARWSRGRRLWNGYGPTEATVCATIEEHRGCGHPPIGRPLHGVLVYVLDDHQRLVPYGVAGELYIGGSGVARGYLGRPELTAERFVPDPFAAEPQARMYRTGDRVRVRADGRFEFLGRLDRQVQLRGQRVEPGEIEATLRAHQSVSDVAVAALGEPSRGLRLVAYVVPTSAAGVIDVQELRRHLAARLPAHMLPAAIVALASLPLTPHGKLDRQALPGLESATAPSACVVPLTKTQRRLAKLWGELLQREHIGPEDEFFALGGHSLLATQLVARIRTVFGAELPLRSVFEAPTLAGQAEAIETLLDSSQAGAPTAGGSSEPVALTSTGAQPALFCVHPGNGQVSGYAALARRLAGRRPVYAFEAPGLAPGEAPIADIRALARRHVEQLLRFQPHGPHVLVGWSAGGVVAFEMARQLELRRTSPAVLVQLDSYRNVQAPCLGGDENLGAFAAFGRDLGLAPEILVPLLAQLAGVAASERCSLLLAEGRRAGVFPPEWSPDSVARRFAVFAAQIAGSSSYAPAPISTPILFLRALERRDADPAAEWQELTTGGFTLADVAGDHYTLLSERHVGALAATLELSLSAWPAATTHAGDDDHAAGHR